MKTLLFSFAALCLLISCSESKKDISHLFESMDGCLVIYDYQNDEYIKHNPERCAERYLPASTFKIPNSLIGLETGVIGNENFVIPWDSTKRFVPAWNRDHNLTSAIKHSVVPYYQELARRVGRETIQHYLDTLVYGSQTIGEKIDTFWLDNSLKISADEQIAFLVHLYENKVPFSQRNIDIVKRITITDSTESYIEHAKTGAGRHENNNYVGWYVGYYETGSNTYFFAMNLEDETYEAIKDKRQSIVRQAMRELNYIPKD